MSPEGDDSWERLLRMLVEHPAQFALYGLIAALIVSIAVGASMPPEFWAALIGLLTGLGHQIKTKGKGNDE